MVCNTRNPTWKNLRDAINRLPENHLDDNIVIFMPNENEWFPIRRISKQEEDDIINKGCLFLVLDTENDEELS
jgi:hypothetical protein